MWRAARPGEVDRFGVEDAIAGRAMCTAGLGVDNLADWSCTVRPAEPPRLRCDGKHLGRWKAGRQKSAVHATGRTPERAGQAARPRRRMGAAPAKGRRGPRGFSSGGLS